MDESTDPEPSQTQERPRVRRRRAATINLVFGFAGLAVSIINGFALVPIYLANFSIATYGAWLASGGVLSLITVVDPGIGIVATQKLGKSVGNNDLKEFARISGSSIQLTLAVAVLVFLVSIPVCVLSPYWFSCPLESVFGLQCANLLSATAVA